jgi:transposase-like protein
MIMRWIVLVVSAVACVPVKSADAPAAVSAPTTTRPQPPPLPTPPIEFFRQLLGMKPEEREKALALREPKTRQFLEDKIRQFAALPADERENRLRTLELRWYLLPLMKSSPTNREPRLQAIPERDRKLVEARVQFWDQLPAEIKRDMLESELAIGVIYLPEKGVVSHAGLSTITPQQQEKIKKSIDYLNRLAPDKRRRVFRSFEGILRLSQEERAKALDNFSENERKQMQRTLQTFEKLSPTDRDLCVTGFQKFSALSEEERQDFLRNVERWRTMSDKDRAVWRSLVNRKVVPQPPMPPGLPGAAPRIKVASPDLATNSAR